MKTPAFQQFADQLHSASDEMQHHAEQWRGLIDVPELQAAQQRTVDALRLAERHVRLLQTLWEWATSPVDERPEGNIQLTELGCKDHVRSLLAPHAEDQ